MELNQLPTDKQCIYCNGIFPLHLFSKDKTRKDGLNPRCRACLKIDRKMNPLKYKNYYLTRDFGISLKDFEKMNLNQNGVCKICKKTNKKRYKCLAVDHCHLTNKIRGLLCENCNKGIGMFHDNIDLLNSAINYLKENA